jgi:hypothetical protein
MRFSKTLALFFLMLLGCPCFICSQDSDREVEIHRNVKLSISPAGSEIPAGIASQYTAFLPMLEATLKESTANQSDDCALTVKVSPFVKEIGSANKVKRAAVKITAYRKNAKQEFTGNLILYSYVNSGPVNKEETQQFLQKQILGPCECVK